MRTPENTPRLAADLYVLRERARGLLGARYKDYMAELGRILTATAERDRKPVLVVAAEIAKKRSLIGMDLLLVMAAAVELVEPSPAQEGGAA